MPFSEGATNVVNGNANSEDNKDNLILRHDATTKLMVRCIPSRGMVGDFYDDDKDEDDNDGDDNEEDHCPCLFQKVLPMQSTAMPKVRMTTITSFYDATTNLMVRYILGRGWGGMTMITMPKIRKTTMMMTITMIT